MVRVHKIEGERKELLGKKEESGQLFGTAALFYDESQVRDGRRHTFWVFLHVQFIPLLWHLVNGFRSKTQCFNLPLLFWSIFLPSINHFIQILFVIEGLDLLGHSLWCIFSIVLCAVLSSRSQSENAVDQALLKLPSTETQAKALVWGFLQNDRSSRQGIFG